MHTCMHAIAAPTTPNSTHGSNQGIIFSTSCFRARIVITCIVIYFFLSVCTLAGCVYEWTSQSEFHKRTLYSLTGVKPGVFEHFGYFLFLHMPAAWLQLYPSSFVSGEFFKMAQKKASLLRNRLLWWLQKNFFPQNKVWLGNHRSNTHTHKD